MDSCRYQGHKRKVKCKQLSTGIEHGCRIHRLHLCRWVRPPPMSVLDMTQKQSDGEVPVMLGLWGMQSTPSLPLLPGSLWLSVVAPDRALSMGQIELRA